MILIHKPTSSLLHKDYSGSPVSVTVDAIELIRQALSLYCTIINKKNAAFPYSRNKKLLDNLAGRALKRYKRRMKIYSIKLATN